LLDLTLDEVGGGEVTLSKKASEARGKGYMRRRV